MPGDPDIFLAHRERLTGGDPDLLLDEIHIGDRLRYRVFHLDPRVHFHEIEIFLFIQKELDGSRILISDCFRRPDRRLPHLFAEFIGDRRRRGLFKDFLVSSLDRAVALAEMDDISVSVTQDLEFDMARILHKPLDVHGIVGKSFDRLHLGV